jgi:hypothetical protein
MSPIQIEFNCLAVGQYQCFWFLGFAKGFFFGGSAAVMSAKKDRPWCRRRRKSCDFQGYHHRRQKELIVKIVVSTMGVNPSADKKSTHPPLNP